MTKSSLVTILIPTYNRAEYLRDAITSALAQTHRNIEVLVLDDASPDYTPAIVTEFADDPRLRYLRHNKNLGIAGNWKVGIEAAQGEFFCILHDDDTFEQTFVETLARPLLDDSSLILAFCDHWLTDEIGTRQPQDSDQCSRRFHRSTLSAGRLTDFKRAAVVHGSPPIGATMFRRNMVSLNFIHESAKGSIDAWLFYQCVKTGQGAYYVPRRLMNYRAHSGGMSASMPLYMGQGHVYRYERILADPTMASVHADIKKALAVALTSNGIHLIPLGKYGEARQSLSQSLRLRPSLRGLCAYLLACGGAPGGKTVFALRNLKKQLLLGAAART